MSQFNSNGSYYSSDVHYGTYDANYSPQTATTDSRTFDASLPLTQNDSYTPHMNQGRAYFEPEMFLESSDGIFYTSSIYAPPHVADASHLAYPPGNGTVCPKDLDVRGQYHGQMPLYDDYGSMMYIPTSSPMDISPALSGLDEPTGWYPGVSVTPPNEDVSSGSDGGSDDHHLMLVSPSPPHDLAHPTTPPREVTSTTQEASAIKPSKPSYYRSRVVLPISHPVPTSAAKPTALTGPARAGAMGALSGLPFATKKVKACSSCKRRKLPCSVPAPGGRCNQCLLKPDLPCSHESS